MPYNYLIKDISNDSGICFESLRKVSDFMKIRYPDVNTISHNTISKRLNNDEKMFKYYDLLIHKYDGGIILKE